MPTLLSVSRSDPVPVPAMGEEQPSSYREIIKLLAAQAPKPYGAIPPLLKKRKKKNKSRRVEQSQERKEQQKPIRRMSHVEDWIVVDSKESLPDEEELLSKSPFRNFLSADFLTQVLPLHMPPPSLSDPTTLEPEVPGKLPPALPQRAPQVSGRESPKRLHELGVQSVDDASDDEEEYDEEEEEDDDDDDEVDTIVSKKGRSRLHPKWKSDGEEEDDDAKSNGHGLVMKSSVSSSSRLLACHHELVRRHSLSSFTKAKTPSTSTTPSYVMSSSPPLHADTQQVRWMQTIAQLRKSLVLSSSLSSPSPVTSAAPPRPASKKKDGFIPMPPAPRRPPSQRRRSEATTQPRFNPETNTYTRDTRSNPDHLRMISSELNMMRARKLLSPLKPRGFLPRRKDPFVRGNGRKESRLRYEVL